jgi:hypothetical protein
MRLGQLLSACSLAGCSARGCLELQLQLRGGIELNAAGRQCGRGEGSSLDPARVAAICDFRLGVTFCSWLEFKAGPALTPPSTFEPTTQQISSPKLPDYFRSFKA